MKKNVLSLFDGISGLQVALKRAKIKFDNYCASEINEGSIAITQKNFPNTIQVGDVTKLNAKDFKDIYILSAGSPCTNFSVAGKRNGMVTTSGIEITSLKQYLTLKKKGYKFDGESYLFWEFVRLVKEIKPKYFFLENVRMNNKWSYIISRELGVLPIKINSSLVSAQNRERWYWTNIPGISVPVDMGIKVWDVIPDAVAGYGLRGVKDDRTNKYVQNGTTRKDFKANCLVTKKGNTSKLRLFTGDVRDITIEEAELLQTLPKNYTKVKGISETKRFHGIGNGWTIDVIVHLLKGLKK
jgi:DNA (cytosine-5)-methyltransferase 3A